MEQELRSNDSVVVWPDGTWCYWSEVSEYGWKSDDYEVLEPCTPQWKAFLKAEGEW